MRQLSLFVLVVGLVLVASACGGDNLDLCDGCATQTATPTSSVTPTSATSTPVATPFGIATTTFTPGG